MNTQGAQVARSAASTLVFIYATVQIIREGYKSVLMMYIVEVNNDTITGVQALQSEWEERSRNQYNNTKLVCNIRII